MSARGTALVTGASSGIGYELAKQFAQAGYHLVLVARSADVLRQLADEWSRTYRISVTPLVYDLAQPSAPEAIAHALANTGVTINVLVNNAGFGTYGKFSESDPVQELGMIQVNITALTHLTRLLLPGMIERHRGIILNVASTAAFQPGPLMAVYYASKAYVVSFSQALANDLRGTGVTVTALCPGPTATNFSARAGVTGTRIFHAGKMSAEAVARDGYRGAMRGQAVIISGWRNAILAHLVRWLPPSFVVRMVQRVQETRR
jgi:short-subunit dehydrogenase